MLARLSIRNVLLIDQLDMDVPAGLVTLTGETGAGKSILLDSLALGLGERSDPGLMRQGADQASVSLTFTAPKKHAVHALLQELGLRSAGNDDPLILRRVLGSDGRSRAFVDDQPVAVGALKKLGALLVDIHGQFETHGLLDRENHLGYLDSFAGCTDAAQNLREKYEAWQAARAAHQQAKNTAAELARRTEDLQHSVAELAKLAPLPGEAELLAEKRSRLQAREKIMESLRAALHDLQGDEGAARKLAGARRILARAAEKAGDLVQPILGPLAAAEDALLEANAALENLSSSDDFDVNALEAAEERLFALRAAARKYQCGVDDLADLRARMESESAALAQTSDTLKKLQHAEEETAAAYRALAEELHARRVKAARSLEARMQAELPPLKLEKAKLAITVEKLDEAAAGPNGLSRVTFGGSTNPDMPAGPLHKIASGGELARFMLALRLCLAEHASMTTLIFDEVDTGIGGATADAVGERLSRLGETMQTLVITHSPQVAARGANHWRVEKSFEKNISRTHVRVLSREERREEIARMLAGSAVTDAARQAAESLLAGSGQPEKKKRKVS